MLPLTVSGLIPSRQALRDAERASSLDPKCSVAALRRGAALSKLDRAPEAGGALLECMEREGPTGPAVDQWATPERWGEDMLTMSYGPPRPQQRRPLTVHAGGGRGGGRGGVGGEGQNGGRPEGDSAVTLFGNVLGQIRRERSFPELGQFGGSPFALQQKQQQQKSPMRRPTTGHGLGPARLPGDDDDINEANRYPAACGPVQLVELRKLSMKVCWREAVHADDEGEAADDWMLTRCSPHSPDTSLSALHTSCSPPLNPATV